MEPSVLSGSGIGTQIMASAPGMKRPVATKPERSTKSGSKMYRPKIAALLTEYGENSHGNAILSKLLDGLDFPDRTDSPRCDVVAMHLMEIVDGSTGTGSDIGIRVSDEYGIARYHTVAAALCQGGEELAVDGVLIIGEHGTWPKDQQGRLLYPRRELFDQVAGVFRQARRSVPVFCDKELSWSWPWALHMWKEVQELDIPFMAGSSIPWAAFEPDLSSFDSAAIDHLVVIGHGMLDRYGIHVLEAGQRVVEQRTGGERGVRRVRCVGGTRDITRVDPGDWPEDVVVTALGAAGHQHALANLWNEDCCAIDVEYQDGERMTILMVNPTHCRFSIAYRERNGVAPRVAAYEEPSPPRLRHFSAMVKAIEELFLTGTASMAPERNLLTTGMLAAAFDSRAADGMWLDTPELP